MRSYLVKGVYLSFFTIIIFVSCQKEKITGTNGNSLTPPPEDTTFTKEIIFIDREWNFWHDLNDPTGVFDEIYFYIIDSINRIPDDPIGNWRVDIKKDSIGNWERASKMSSPGTQSPLAPFYYSLTADYLLIIPGYNWDRNLVGKKAAVRIRY
jgi:hypothetical protein